MNRAHHDVGAITLMCLHLGVKTASVPVALYVWGAIQHSPGSASFNPDGSRNEAVVAAQTSS